MKRPLQWTLFASVAVILASVLILIAIPPLRNRIWFALDRGEGVPVSMGRILRPTVPVWVKVEPHVTMRLDPADEVDRAILLDGEWEPNTWHGISEHVPPGGGFVDVGAQVGYYSLKAASKVGPGGRVLAIEPNPETVERLRANIRASGASVVSVAAVACSDSEGSLELFGGPTTNTGASSLARANAAHAGPVGATYRVRSRPLDDIVAESGMTRVDAIKIDVEGAELLVLKGAGKTLDRYHPVLVMELIEPQLANMGTSSAEVYRFLRGHGYAARHKYGEYGQFQNTEFAFVPGLSSQSK